jgi:hypothetical protein
MARTHSSRLPLPGSLRARRKVWALYDNSVAIVANTPNASSMTAVMEAALGSELIGVTVLRIVGWVQAMGVIDCTHGFAVLPNSALPAAISPVGNSYLDWMFFRRIRAVAGQSLDSPSASYAFDLRSRRRIDEINQELIHAWEGPTAGSFEIHARILVALP